MKRYNPASNTNGRHYLGWFLVWLFAITTVMTTRVHAQDPVPHRPTPSASTTRPVSSTATKTTQPSVPTSRKDDTSATKEASAKTSPQKPSAFSTSPGHSPEKKEVGGVASRGDETQREYAQDFIRDYWSKGPLLAFLLIFFAGFLVSLTPCVYPMIPITIAVIGATSTSEHHGRGHSFLMAFFYVVGMAIPYAILGVVVALIGRQPLVLGSIFNSPYFLGFLVALFGLMALSMFGAFDLSLPTSWQTKMSMFQGKGFLGILVLGMIGALLATPCSGPVIVGLLAFIAQTGDITWGLVMPTVFTFGIGVPFLILGGGVVQALPRSGKWMTEVKKVFGVILLAACLYYGYLLARRLIPQDMQYFTLGLSFLAIFLGFAAGAFQLYDKTQGWWLHLKQAFGLISLIVGLYLLVGTLLWKGFLLPPWSKMAGTSVIQVTSPATKTGTSVAPQTPQDPCLAPANHPVDRPYWLTSEQEGVRCAQKHKRPMIIDFWAEWCTSCKQLEKESFNTREVAQESRRFLMVKYEYNEATPEDTRLRKKYMIRGLPWVRFVDTQGHVLNKPRIVGFKKASDLLDMMKQVR